MQLPPELRSRLETIAGTVPLPELRAAASRISAAYRAGGLQHSPLRGPADHIAYAIVRMPATLAALDQALRELAVAVPGLDPRSFLDCGAGAGTAASIVSRHFPALDAITLVENDRNFEALARQLLESSLVAWRHEDLRTVAAPPHDLVLASYSLNELPDAQFAATIDRLFALARHALIVLEPGTPAGYARILAARERLLEAGATIAAPCPHHFECPLARRAGDWCHFAARVERTSLHRQLKGGDLGHEDEKFCYLAAVRVPPAERRGRILRHPRRLRGHVQLLLCTPEGEAAQQTVTRSQKEPYRSARQADWGDRWP